MSRWLPAFLLVFFFLNSSLAQTMSGDPQAIAVLERAVQVLRTPDSPASIRSAVATGTVVYGGATPTQARILWKDLITPSLHEFRRETSSAAGISIVTSGHGHPRWFDPRGRGRDLPSHVTAPSLPLYAPMMSLTMILQDRNSSAQLSTDAPAGMVSVIVTSIEDEDHAAAARTVWFFDANTGMPQIVKYLVPAFSDGLKTSGRTCVYSSFVVVDGVLTPRSIKHYGDDGAIVSEVSIESIGFNVPVVAVDFDTRNEVR